MKTFAVIGMGRFGSAVATKLFSMGYEVLAVDTDTEKINNIAPFVTQAIAGDAKEESVLKALGIRNFDCVIIAVTEDIAASILITLHVKEMGIKQIVCKAQNYHHKKILKKIGADSVIIPEDEVGTKIAVRLVSKNFIEQLELSKDYSIIDMHLPSSWEGKSLSELDVRKRYSINVIAIKNNENITINPEPRYVFRKEDIVVVLGKSDIISAIK